MSRRNTLRFAPSRGGDQLASHWWFTHQGDDFYLASGMGLNQSKISFHGGGNWQMRTAQQVIRFTATRLASEKWLHGASIRWYLSPDAFKPPSARVSKVRLLEIPEDADLVVAVLVSVDDSDPPPIAAMGGQLLFRDHLRDGRSVAIEYLSVAADRQFTARVRGNTVITLTGKDLPEGFYAEVHEIYSEPQQGNFLAVVPLGIDSLRFPERGESEL